jgi:hypothetical protein
MPNVLKLTAGEKVNVKVDGELKAAEYLDWSDKYDMGIVFYEGRRMYRKIFGRVSAPASKTVVSDDGCQVTSTTVKCERNWDINVRFQFLRKMVRMVAVNTPTSLVIVGDSGLGKSFTVDEVMTSCSLEKDSDYVVIKGHATPKSIYRVLWENHDKIVVFDDCDGVFRDEKAVNILKGALETHPIRRVSWLTERTNGSSGEIDGEIPKSFDFEGKIIFISNLKLSDVPEPILGRAMYVDVSMTADEKIARINHCLDNIRRDVSMDIKREVLTLLDDLKCEIKNLNFRTFLKVLEIRMTDGEDDISWKDLATYVVTSDQ